MYPFNLRALMALLSAMALLVVFTGCDSNEPDPGAGEEEFFTRVMISLSGDDGSTVTATASDPDGDKSDIQFTLLALEAGVTYTGSITLFDDINGEEVTEEIAEESAAHLFFYTPQGGVANRLTVTRLDTDSNGAPLGLQMRVVVSSGAAAAGTLNVKLAHYDNEADKRADHTATSRPGSELDLDLNFPVSIN